MLPRHDTKDVLPLSLYYQWCRVPRHRGDLTQGHLLHPEERWPVRWLDVITMCGIHRSKVATGQSEHTDNGSKKIVIYNRVLSMYGERRSGNAETEGTQLLITYAT